MINELEHGNHPKQFYSGMSEQGGVSNCCDDVAIVGDFLWCTSAAVYVEETRIGSWSILGSLT